MNTTKKWLNSKIILLILAMVMLIGCMQTQKVYATENEEDTTWQNDWEYRLNEENGWILLTNYRGTEETYKIPNKATVDGKEYTTRLGRTGMFSNISIKNLSFEKGVQVFEDAPYVFMSTLETIDITGLDLSKVQSMKLWFCNSKKLKKINMSNIEVPMLVNAELMTLGCESLEEIDLSNSKFESLVNASQMFANCGGTIKVNMSNLQVPNVENMSKMFFGCTGIQELDMSNIKVNKLKNMDSIFEGCQELRKINMEGFEAQNVEYVSSAFKNCTSLEKLTIEGIGKINSYSKPIEGCTNLKELTLKNIGIIEKNTFQECETLENLNLENVGTIETFAFQNNNTIKKALFKNTSVKDSAFANCEELKEIIFLGTENVLENGAFYVKPESYRSVYLEYKDKNGHDHYSDTNLNIVPVYTTTHIESEDESLYNYPWAADNRLITDGLKHTVTYNLNGADGENKTYEFTAGDTILEEAPVRDEYNFYGWNTKENGSGKLFVPGEKININSDITLYAQWRKKGYINSEKNEGWAGENVKWKIDNGVYRFYVEGEGNGRMYNQVMQGTNPVSTPWHAINKVVIEEGVTYIGDFSFIGGNLEVVLPDSLEEIGEGAFYLAKITHIENLRDDVKIGKNAFYYTEEENIVTANANGGAYEDGSNEKTYNTRVNLRYSVNNRKVIFEEPHKEGFTFVGWNTKQDGSGEFMKDGYFLTAPKDVIVYAMWAPDKITVTYDAKGGNFSANSVQVYPYEKISEEIPTKDGYIFSEWNTKSDLSGKGYQPGDILHAEEDITLYARWEKPYELNTEHYEATNSASVLYYLTGTDGEKIRVYGASDGSTYNQEDYVEVSVDYLENYFNNRLNRDYGEINPCNFGEREYKKLITFLATSVPYNEGGFSDTFFNSKENYDAEAALIRQFAAVIIDTRNYTSLGLTYLGRTFDYRFEFVEDHYEEIGNKYDLRVFKSQNGVVLALQKRPLTVDVIKKDTNDEIVEGAHLQIVNEKGEIVAEWDSINNATNIEIKEGTYTLKETKAPQDKGYVKAEDITFEVDGDGFITVDGKELDIITMIDDYTKLKVTKIDGETGEILKGAVLKIVNKEGKEIAKWTTEEEPYYIEKIPVGEYILIEEEAPEGYEKSKEINFEVKETGEMQYVEFTNSKIKEEPQPEETQPEEPQPEEPQPEEPQPEEPQPEEPQPEEPQPEEPQPEEPQPEEPQPEEPQQEEVVPEAEETEKQSPQTGDSIMVCSIILIISTIVLLAIEKNIKKKNK